MPRCSRINGSVRSNFDRPRHGVTCRKEQSRCTPRMIEPLTGDEFIARYDKLTKLNVQHVNSLRISSSLQTKRKNMKCNKIAAGKIEGQATLSSSDTVPDDTIRPAQLASTSQVSSSLQSERSNAKCSEIAVEKVEGQAALSSSDAVPDDTDRPAQLASTSQVSSSLQFERSNAKCNEIAAGKIEGQAASTSSDAVPDNITNPAQLVSTSQVSSSLQSERNNAKCNEIAAGNIEGQAASTSSDAVPDNITNPAQLVSTSQVSSSLQSERSKCSEIAVGKIEGQATLSSSDAVPDDTDRPAQLASTSQVSSSLQFERSNAKCNEIAAGKTEGQAASTSSDAVPDNITNPAQLVSTSQDSSSLQSERSNAKCNEIAAAKIEGQIASTSSDAVPDNTTSPAQLAGTSRVSSSHKSTAKNTKHGTADRRERAVKEERTNDHKTTKVSANDRSRTKNLVMNQADTCDNKGRNWRLSRGNARNKAETHMTAEAGNKSSTGKENRSEEMIMSNAKKKRNTERVTKKKIFSDYIPVPKMMNILKTQSLNDSQYVKGNLRVNPSCYKFAYLRLTNEERDLLILGISSRNRALEGDLVVAHVNPEKHWFKCSDGGIQKTGQIVCILEKVHPRRAVGLIKKQESLLMFHPRDHRVPLVEILPESVPPLYHDQPELYKNTMFFVTIDVWEQQTFAFGRVLSVVGKSGEIDTELKAIILENNLDVSPYQETLLEGLPGSDYTLTEADMKDREDWRHKCVFTIDPPTAVDIDDALSCEVLANGNYEIAVHISDVTHYLEFFSPLDTEVLKRATTIYLPHMTSHMLPEQLCKICSLLPGKDRLAFSVIWEMTPDSEVIKYRFAKTVIRSCCQMSYDSAQAMLDNPEKSCPEDFLDIKGDYTASLLSDIVNKLFKLSTQLQNKRFVNGALRLDQPKLQIRIDSTLSLEHGTPVPINYYVYERNDSNSLIEEFMLLANMTVATQLYIKIPMTALLRNHKAPSKHCLRAVYNTLQKYGIHLHIETAGSLQASINYYDSENNSTDTMKYIMMVVVNMCLKAMPRADYICASTTLQHDLKHYALNVPLYTHFTSPIRRYSDCIVHRLLSATLENKPLPEKWTIQLCSKIAANCNVKKYSAKLAQEQSTEVLFAYMVGLSGGFKAVAIVIYVKEDGIEVMLCDTGIKLRISLKDIEHAATLQYSADCTPTVTVNWKEPSSVQVINLFSLVYVQVNKVSEELRLKATLLPPP